MTRPKCPKQWSDEVWNERFVIGDDDYHMFRGGIITNPDSSKETSGRGVDRFFLKVSSHLDPEGRWMYEDIDPGVQSLIRVKLFERQLIELRDGTEVKSIIEAGEKNLSNMDSMVKDW